MGTRFTISVSDVKIYTESTTQVGKGDLTKTAQMQENVDSSELVWDGCLADKEVLKAHSHGVQGKQKIVSTCVLRCCHDKPLPRAPTFILETVLLISSTSPTVTMLDFSIWSINTSQSASSVIVLSRSAGIVISEVLGGCAEGSGGSDAEGTSTVFRAAGWAEIKNVAKYCRITRIFWLWWGYGDMCQCAYVKFRSG